MKNVVCVTGIDKMPRKTVKLKVRSPFSVLRSPFSVLRSPFSVLRSPFSKCIPWLLSVS
jgi:hypothetical protein